MDLLINNFQKKVNLTYLQEFSKMKQIDADTVSGVAMVNKELQDNTGGLNDLSSFTFTADASNDSLTTSGIHGYSGGIPVTVSTTGTLPAGLAVDTVYYVEPELTNTLKVCSSLKNLLSSTQIDVTDAGSGTHTITPVTMGAIKKIVDRNSSGAFFNLFAIDDNGSIWTKYTDGVWTKIDGNTNTNAEDIVVWKDYLFALGTSKIDVYGKLSDIDSGTPAWTNNWATFSDTVGDRPSLVGQDDVIYIGVGKNIASILETSGSTFDPASGGTYTFNDEALDLPDNYQITCLEELGSYLAIGTRYGYNFGAGNVADIYLWDRVSTSFDLPVRLKTQGVRAMINYNNILYVIAGLKGDIYATNGTKSSLVGRVNAQMLDMQQENLQFEVYHNGIAQFRDKIIFGGATSSNGNPIGVFSFNPKTGGVSMDYTVSNDNDSNGIDIFSVYSDSDNVIYVGWQDASGTVSYGLDKLSTTRRYTDDSYIVTGLYRVGQDRRKRVFKHTEISLAKSLETGNRVKVYYRERLDENFTSIGTMSSGFSKIFDMNINVENIQVKIELETSSGTHYSPELISVRLY